ncbi:M56 family metallopeptidase [Mucilaginibacter sp.]|uniref:M56 family metallopeptidase n=1 Tax=Mucilaginibacter sp. TaxID=1882438 RepID=UPI00326757BD
MIAYLIKSALCLTLLLAAYHLFLEKEKMHQFKRFFLLASLVLSSVIPLISFTTNAVRSPIANIAQFENIAVAAPNDNVTIQPATTVVITPSPGLVWQDYICIAYLLGASLLLIRFMVNLAAILIKTRRNERVSIQGAVLVLVAQKVIPNSFLHYIFVNRGEYNNNQLETELLTHELVHVRQKHSLDIILIELLKAVCWLNPVFILYKKAIQLNHEFLADEGVLRSKTDIKAYQNLLLTKAGLYSNYALASNFNYSVTKKRLIMMKHSTSKLRAALTQLALLPLLFALVFVLCVTAEAQQQAPAGKPTPAESSKKQAPIVAHRDGDIYPDSVFIHFTNKDGSKYIKRLSELPKSEQKAFLPFTQKTPLSARRTPGTKLFNSWKDGSTYGVWLNEKHVRNDVLNDYQAKDFVLYYSSKLYGAAKKGRAYAYQVDLYTPEYYDKIKKQIDADHKARTHINIYSMVK